MITGGSWTEPSICYSHHYSIGYRISRSGLQLSDVTRWSERRLMSRQLMESLINYAVHLMELYLQ